MQRKEKRNANPTPKITQVAISNTNKTNILSCKVAPSQSKTNNDELHSLPNTGCGKEEEIGLETYNRQLRERRHVEKQTRKANKKANKNNEEMTVVTQNFNGIMGEKQLEEMYLQMKTTKIDIVCGQEGRRPQRALNRWDTEELFIGFEPKKKIGEMNYKKDGNFFMLSNRMKEAFIRGGKKTKRYCPRLVTIRIPLGRKKTLYLINVHFPDGEKTKEVKQAFQLRFEQALQDQKSGDLLVVAGDFNACTGTNLHIEDGVCGPHGDNYTNDAGRTIRLLAATHQLVDLVTFEKQKMNASYYDKRTSKAKQLDRIFMQQEGQQQVRTCQTIGMLVDSDHEAVKLVLRTTPAPTPRKTTRQNVATKDIKKVFGKTAEAEERKAIVRKVLDSFHKRKGDKGNDYSRLLMAVNDVVESLPTKQRSPRGWCELNESVLKEATTIRNERSRQYAKRQTQENKALYSEARKCVKKLKRTAKNKWLLQEVRASNASLLPGGQNRTGAGTVWNFVRRCKRGVKKWRAWNYCNIKDFEGIMGKGPEDNATNFQAYYNKLYANKETPMRKDESQKWYDRMPQEATDREWRAPTEAEMSRALREIKHTAPGLSGIPIAVWQAMAEETSLKMTMLSIMKECWEKEETPSDWNSFYMTVLEKKGDLSKPKNYRGISIAEAISKIYTTILKFRLSDLYENIAPEFANGFRKGRGRADSVSSVMNTLRARKANGKSSYLLLFDAVKCFDVIKRQHIWKSMEKAGVSAKMIRVVRSTMRDTNAKLHVEGVQRDVTIQEGTGQGTTLGPVLCNFFFLPLQKQWAEMWKRKASRLTNQLEGGIMMTSIIHSFADDVAIIMKNRDDTEEVARDFYRYLQNFLIDIHVATKSDPTSKSVVIFIPAGKKVTEPKKEDAIIVDSDNELSINFVKQATYLGHVISCELTDDQHMRTRMAKTSQIFGALGKNVFRNKDVWKSVKAQIMTTMILPVLLDGAECSIISTKVMADMETLYHRLVRSCLHITPYTQRKFKISSEELLRRLGIRPLHYYLDLKFLAYAGHVERMQTFRLPKFTRDGRLQGKSKPGRPVKTIQDCLKSSLKRKNIKFADWPRLSKDRSVWAKLIRNKPTNETARVKPRKQKERFPASWATSPSSLIGQYVEKRFGAKWYVGRIMETNTDEHTNEQIWNISYDDGDKEDYSARQLIQIICTDLDKYI